MHAFPDYSFRAHARYLLELFDAVRILKIQLVAFSVGGGVERLASIVMRSAIGVQEQELLGMAIIMRTMFCMACNSAVCGCCARQRRTSGSSTAWI
jgi:hypothetical protein